MYLRLKLNLKYLAPLSAHTCILTWLVHTEGHTVDQNHGHGCTLKPPAIKYSEYTPLLDDKPYMAMKTLFIRDKSANLRTQQNPDTNPSQRIVKVQNKERLCCKLRAIELNLHVYGMNLKKKVKSSSSLPSIRAVLLPGSVKLIKKNKFRSLKFLPYFFTILLLIVQLFGQQCWSAEHY